MFVNLLGSAAGGGFPQWNCGCRNCSASRAGTLAGKPRTQTQVAVSSDGSSWFLLNASPDLRLQIESSPKLRPHANGRSSPISGVVVTSADVDAIAGLLSLRELQPLQIHCTPSLRRILREDNSIFAMLNRVREQANWINIFPNEDFQLSTSSEADSALHCRAISIGSHYPVYVSPSLRTKLSPAEASLALFVSADASRLGFVPAIAQVDDVLFDLLSQCDVVLFDGTFWTDDELIKVQGHGATAKEMGHIPVSGPDGSLRRLADLKKPRKIYLHINNTNPVLDESSPVYREVRDAGWEIAEDGWQIQL